MDRRQLLKGMMLAGAGSMLISSPLTAIAQSMQNAQRPVNYKSLFNEALKSTPELVGFSDIDANFAPQILKLEGAIPRDLVGTFYRNGPAKHERQDQRYKHLFEGDGMLQRFAIADGKIQHHGKFIDTPKFQKEQQADEFLYSGPDTLLPNSLPISSADAVNTANTNVIPVGDDLWALWEAGSPTKVDANTLEYQEQVTLGKHENYGNKLKGLPFSAHPKIDPNGDIWNFGLNPTGHIVLYHLAPNGQVKNVGMINTTYRGAMLHDFLITDKHLLLILPSLTTSRTSSKSMQGMFSSIKFDASLASQVLVVSKADLTIKKRFELPAGFAFHYGNAWEEKDGTIRFDASLYPNVDVLHDLSKVMMGETQAGITDEVSNAKTALFTLRPNGTASQTVLDVTSEFPRVCEHRVGLQNTYLYQLSSANNSLWSDTVSAMHVDSGKIDSYHFGADYLVEEHIPICPQHKEGTGYLMGTALHVPSKRTCLNIFKADRISDGPITRAWLSHHLPLGFHGNFKAA